MQAKLVEWACKFTDVIMSPSKWTTSKRRSRFTRTFSISRSWTEGEGDAFFKLGEHQFLAIFEVEKVQPANVRHFGIMVRDEQQLAEVRKKLTGKYKLKLEPPFRCDFRDPWGNRIQVVDLHDESLIWLLPYREVQKAGVKFGETP